MTAEVYKRPFEGEAALVAAWRETGLWKAHLARLRVALEETVRVAHGAIVLSSNPGTKQLAGEIADKARTALASSRRAP